MRSDATPQADDCTNAVRLDLRMVDGRAAQLTLGSCIVNYFIDYLDGGIKAGQERGLFVERASSAA